MSATISAGSRGAWRDDEHERFREALELFPTGPWKAVAEFVGTRTVRQVQTHAQKYHEKAARQLRDLRLNRTRHAAPTQLIDFEMQGLCQDLHRHRVLLSPRPSPPPQAGGTEYSTETPSPSVPSFDECIDYLVELLDGNSDDWVDVELFDASSISSYSSTDGGSP